MADLTEPRLIRIPGPVYPTWEDAELPVSTVATPSPSAAVDPVGDATGLRLRADPNGSFGLACRDGSLGRLTLPQTIAIDAQLRVYLLDTARGLVLRCDPSSPRYDPAHPFERLPGIGNDLATSLSTDDPRRLSSAVSIAVDRHSLYIADRGNPRVLVLALEALTLQSVWPFPAATPPLDVIADGDRVYVLTAGSLFRWQLGANSPHLFATTTARQGWSRLAVDYAHRIYVLLNAPTKAQQSLQVLDPHNPAKSFQITDPGEVRDLFSFPAVYTIPDETPSRPLRFVMPASLTLSCGRQLPVPDPTRPLETSLARIPTPLRSASTAVGAFVFGSTGDLIDPKTLQPPRTPLYQIGGKPTPSGQIVSSATTPDPNPAGVWISAALDSKLFRCQWHRVELGFADLPAGTAVTIQTYTADLNDPDVNIWMLQEAAWMDGLTITGTNRKPTAKPQVKTDFLVNSPPGQFLWLRIRFRGDGFATPMLQRVTLRFPRQSYLEYLPAVFSQDEQSRRFLEHFLSVFQTIWDPLEARVASMAGLFGPSSVPDVLLSYLAGWLGIEFDNGWTLTARRKFLQKVPGLLFAPRRAGNENPGGSRRGTPGGLRDYLAAVLPILTGNENLDTSRLPVVIEGFRERDYRLLPNPKTVGNDSHGEQLPASDPTGPVAAAEGPSRVLWGPDSMGRFQLGQTSQLGEARLLPANNPESDLFRMHAHRFRIVVPAGWVSTPAAEASLRKVIETEKPAHTDYELDLVRPRFRIGVQSTVGVNSIVAGSEMIQIGSDDSGTTIFRLGSGAVLGPSHAKDQSIQLGQQTRLGIDSRVS